MSAAPAAGQAADPIPPAIVLVRPQLGMNIGACARAMANFGLADLRLVAPRDGWPNAEAGPSAAGADWVLDAASVHDSIDAAVADCTLVLGTAMDTRDMVRRVLTPVAAAAELRRLPARAALLFGPERTGLVQADLLRCHGIVSIPTAAGFGSLNLAQALVVMAYQWFVASDGTPPDRTVNHPGPAPHAELMALIADVEARLAANGYFNPVPGRAASARRMLRNILTRPGFTGAEVRSLRGIVRGLSAPRRPAPDAQG